MRTTLALSPLLATALLPLLLYSYGCRRISASRQLPPIAVEDSLRVETETARVQKAIVLTPLTGEEITVAKNLAYDKYTLEDRYKYQDTFRIVSWSEIKEKLAFIENMQQGATRWGVLQNYQNRNGEAPLVESYYRDEYRRICDDFGVQRYQSVPLFSLQDTLKPQRYARDGSPVKLIDSLGGFLRLALPVIEEEYYVPKRYVKRLGAIDSVAFRYALIVDRHAQNIVTLQQKARGEWEALSLNPCTTGRHKPPYAQETPLGIFLLQQKKSKMFYTEDGTNEIKGYAPFASRFTNGAYLHGVPTQHPNDDYAEWSWSLGTTPRSHMCVRLASSHAQFIFERFPLEKTLVVVIGRGKETK